MILALAVVAAVGYAAGRLRPGQRAFRWAEDRDQGPHGPGWWIAQAIGLAAVVWMLTVHPRRSMANRRSWQEARNTPRSPAVDIPRYDPHRPERGGFVTSEHWNEPQPFGASDTTNPRPEMTE